LDEIKNATNTRNGLTALSKKDIKNAFDYVPFGNLTYGLLGSVPAEMLHVGGTGILKYIFKYLDNLIAGDKDKETYDDLHRQLVKDAQRQSERDFLRMSVHNGITDGTKMCRSERVENAFILLCLFHTQLGQKLICSLEHCNMCKRLAIAPCAHCFELLSALKKRFVNGPSVQISLSSGCASCIVSSAASASIGTKKSVAFRFLTVVASTSNF